LLPFRFPDLYVEPWSGGVPVMSIMLANPGECNLLLKFRVLSSRLDTSSCEPNEPCGLAHTLPFLFSDDSASPSRKAGV
jgi:hypothetical protein